MDEDQLGYCVEMFASLAQLDLHDHRAESAWDLLSGWMKRAEALIAVDLNSTPPADFPPIWDLDRP